MSKEQFATNGESPDEWYEREKTAFRAWWESDDNEKTFSSTPTMAAGAGWFARAEAAPETAPIVPCLATNGCTTPEWCARNGDACRVKTPVSETACRDAIIEECAKIAESYDSENSRNYSGLAADAIRALKNAAPQAPAVTGKAPPALTGTEQPAGVAPSTKAWSEMDGHERAAYNAGAEAACTPSAIRKRTPTAWIWHYADGHSSLRWRPDHNPISSDVPDRVTPLYRDEQDAKDAK